MRQGGVLQRGKDNVIEVTKAHPRRTWRRRAIDFVAFVLLFALYDLTLTNAPAEGKHGISLVNYIVRNGRTDESAMYLPAAREIFDGDWKSTDPYLVEHKRDWDVKPRLPVWISAACHFIGRTPNRTVLLLHTIPPALSAVLLIELSSSLLGVFWARAVTLLSVGGMTYQFNYYIGLLRIADLAGPATYNPEFHLFWPYSLRLDFSRFFSPGISFGFFILGLLPMLADPDFRRSRTAALVGAGVALQLDVYLHGALILGVMAVTLRGIAFWRRAGSIRANALFHLCRDVFFGVVAGAVVGAPWLVRFFAFRQGEHATEIMHRVGFLDANIDVYRTPVLGWLVLAVVLRRAANRAGGRSPGSFLDTPIDRFWSALLVTSFITGWAPGILGQYELFPDPFLIPFRYLSYLTPLLLAYPIRLWSEAKSTRKSWLNALLVALAIGYGSLLFIGEIAAGINDAHLMVVSPEVARFRNEALPKTSPKSTILADDLRIVSYLVCETDRNTTIGYASVSNAGTTELIERLMIPSILVDRSFDEFYAEHYEKGYGLPQGPSGQHWVLHHGGDNHPVPREQLAAMYGAIKALPEREIVDRYPFDSAYIRSGRLAPRFSELLEQTDVESFYWVRTKRP